MQPGGSVFRSCTSECRSPLSVCARFRLHPFDPPDPIGQWTLQPSSATFYKYSVGHLRAHWWASRPCLLSHKTRGELLGQRLRGHQNPNTLLAVCLEEHVGDLCVPFLKARKLGNAVPSHRVCWGQKTRATWSRSAPRPQALSCPPVSHSHLAGPHPHTQPLEK